MWQRLVTICVGDPTKKHKRIATLIGIALVSLRGSFFQRRSDRLCFRYGRF
jgi:hypothetical protein